MDRRIRPWVNKKIIEYIGEEELTLTDFICSKVGHFLVGSVNFPTGVTVFKNSKHVICVIFELRLINFQRSLIWSSVCFSSSPN